MNSYFYSYYSGYCSYEIGAVNEDQACEKVEKYPVNYNEVIETLDNWKDCDEIEPI